MARNLMIVGTASNVGKSIICTALCRILAQDGYRVAPFKAQNMSLNSAATPSGREIGRAQAVQAEACGILPNEHMNPVLLKPTGEMRTQVVLQGRVHDTQPAVSYFLDTKDALWEAVVESYRYLRDRYDLLVIEGAGSPVEMNLKARDIANMRTAELADAAVLLVADIDRGGVFASVVGTLQLLEPDERARVRGVIVNKFRGDPALFAEGVRLLEAYAGVPVLGVLPYIHDIGIDEEDSVALESDRYRPRAVRHGERGTDRPIRIGIVRLPHIANFTDVDPLFLEPDVDAHFLPAPVDLTDVDALVLPGTKSTMGDMRWLHETGWVDAIRQAARRGVRVLGICGGYQMLGLRVLDPEHHEGLYEEARGLGLLPHETVIGSEKRTVCVEGELLGRYAGIPATGYEIHMGVTQPTGRVTPFARVRQAGSDDWREEGSVAADGRLIGTYLHGILHNDAFRTAWLNEIRADKGLPAQSVQVRVDKARSEAFDRLAATVRAHLDMSRLYAILEGSA